MSHKGKFVLADASEHYAVYQVGNDYIKISKGQNGQISLSFGDGTFAVNFDSVGKPVDQQASWPADNHPVLNDLPCGEDTARAWLYRAVAGRALRDMRHADLLSILVSKSQSSYLSTLDCISQRFHDKEERVYFHCGFLLDGEVPVVVVNRRSSLRDDAIIERWGDATWRELTAKINPVFDANPQAEGLEALSQDHFNLLRIAFAEFRVS